MSFTDSLMLFFCAVGSCATVGLLFHISALLGFICVDLDKIAKALGAEETRP